MVLRRLLILSMLVLGSCGATHDAKEAVKRTLLDPTSPLFRDVEPCFFNSEVIEGEVNAKNRFGTYTGFEHFLYANGEAAIGYDDSNWSRLFDLCTKNMPKDPGMASATSEEVSPAVRAAGIAADKAASEAANGIEPTKGRRYPYKMPDGVDITNSQDERNYKRYGTTDPDGGE